AHAASLAAAHAASLAAAEAAAHAAAHAASLAAAHAAALAAAPAAAPAASLAAAHAASLAADEASRAALSFAVAATSPAASQISSQSRSATACGFRAGTKSSHFGVHTRRSQSIAMKARRCSSASVVFVPISVGMSGFNRRSRSASLGSESFQERMNVPTAGDTQGGVSDQGLPATQETNSMTHAPFSKDSCEP